MDLNNYNYDIAKDRIALFPSKKRNTAKLLFYNKGKMSHHIFHEFETLLHPNTHIIANQTKVFPARLIFTNAKGQAIEILLITKIDSAKELWECMIGSKKNWKEGTLLHLKKNNISIKAEWSNRDKNIIAFMSDKNNLSFSQVLQTIGNIPLPPYIKRASVKEDRLGYQTLYANKVGSIAAPTAGLHFERQQLKSIQSKFLWHEVCLHISKGTFLPIRNDNITLHHMHKEYFFCQKKTLVSLMENPYNILAVGTTVVRILESLYWMAHKIKAKSMNLEISQNDPHQYKANLTRMQAIEVLLEWMEKNNKQLIESTTQLYIYPPYPFVMIDLLLTNFHQPKSSLLVLIAAYLGPKWKEVYQEALKKNYKFFSYGDVSLLKN